MRICSCDKPKGAIGEPWSLENGGDLFSPISRPLYPCVFTGRVRALIGVRGGGAAAENILIPKCVIERGGVVGLLMVSAQVIKFYGHCGGGNGDEWVLVAFRDWNGCLFGRKRLNSVLKFVQKCKF